MTTVRVLCAVGTRPEAIKMAPVVRALRSEPWAEVRLLATAQHRQMLAQTLRLFDLRPDVDLDIMQPDQPLAVLMARLIEELDRALVAEAPNVVLAQGDRTTVLAAGLVCAYRRAAFSHVEAGLRTGNYDNPFMARGVSRYGDGCAALRIAAILAREAAGYRTDAGDRLESTPAAHRPDSHTPLRTV
jgi:UDP-N-acetylglucosamine 2-epimerase (non-hydrolysing)